MSEKNILAFRNECKGYYQAFLKKIIDRSPLSYPLTRYISCIRPEPIASYYDVAFKRLKFCLEHMVQKHHIAGIVADKVREEYAKLCSIPFVKSSLESYRQREQRLDKFCVEMITVSGKEFSNLLTFMKKVLIISHGNATLERGLSINKEYLVVNLVEESLAGQRIVYDAIQAAGSVNDVVITKSLLQYTKNAHARYLEALDQKGQNKAAKENEGQRKRAAAQAIKELELKKTKLLAEAQKEAAILDQKMKNLLE